MARPEDECMLKPRKKLTRQEIKQDRFVTWVVRAGAVAQERAKQWVMALGAVVVALILVVSVRQHLKDRSREAQDLLGQAQSDERAGAAFDQIAPLYQRVIDKYGNTSSAAQARIRLAEAKLAAGDTQGARLVFDQYLRKHKTQDPLLYYAAWTGVGACLENDAKYAEAAAHYLRFAERYPKSPYAPQALLDSARSFELAGDAQRARETLQLILDKHGTTAAAYQARRQLNLL
jgi:outer membrane protein assembly factor BamD (BamD/ComL family)